jgi:hypothetical protein
VENNLERIAKKYAFLVQQTKGSFGTMISPFSQTRCCTVYTLAERSAPFFDSEVKLDDLAVGPNLVWGLLLRSKTTGLTPRSLAAQLEELKSFRGNDIP